MGAALLLLGALTGVAVPQAAGAQQAQTTLYMDTAGAAVGEPATSQLVVFLAQGETLGSFDIEVAFSPGVIQLEGAQLAPGWAALAETGDMAAANLVRVRGHKETAICSPGSTCLLAVLSWRATAEGTSALTVEHAELLDEKGSPLSISTAPGSIVTGGVAASVANSAPVPEQAERSDAADGLGASDASVGIGVMLLAGLAVTLPAVVWQLRRTRKTTPVRTQASHSIPDGLASAVADYLETFETAGRIDIPVDPVYEQIARQGSRNGTTGNGTMPADTTNSDARRRAARIGGRQNGEQPRP